MIPFSCNVRIVSMTKHFTSTKIYCKCKYTSVNVQNKILFLRYPHDMLG